MSATVFFQDSNEFATLTNVFKVNGVPTDATTVVLTITDPNGNITTPATTHPSTGTYTANVACTAVGTWTYLWEGTGTASDAVAGTWTVTTIALNQRYCSVEELKSRLAIPDTGDDLELQLAVEAASRQVDEMCGRYFWRGTDTRTYVPDSMSWLSLDDLVSVTSFKVDQDGDGVFEETWILNTDFRLQVGAGRYNTAARGEQWPYTSAVVITGGKLLPNIWQWSRYDRVQVVGVYGWPAVPLAVKQATLIAAQDLFRRKDAAFGIAGFGEFGVVRVSQNPVILQLLHRYINPQRVGV